MFGVATRGAALALTVTVCGCDFAHSYRSGEVPRLQLYDVEALKSIQLPCEGFDTSVRRDGEGRRLFLFSHVGSGSDCSGPSTANLVVLTQGVAARRIVVPYDGALLDEEGTPVGDHVDGHRDQTGAPYFFRQEVRETRVMSLAEPTRVVAHSDLARGFPIRLLSKGKRHYLCGWMRDVGVGQGACDVFESIGPSGEWTTMGRLTFGNHQVVDIDPSSEVVLVETQRDDMDPLLFTVDLLSWKWKYIGAGPSWSMLFMNEDPLDRPNEAATRGRPTKG